MGFYCHGRHHESRNRLDDRGIHLGYFYTLAELHLSLYLPTVFWPIMDYGDIDITSQARMPDELVTDCGMGHRLDVYGRGMAKVE